MPHSPVGNALESTLGQVEDLTKGVLTFPFEAGTAAAGTVLRPLWEALLTLLLVIGLILVVKEAP